MTIDDYNKIKKNIINRYSKEIYIIWNNKYIKLKYDKIDFVIFVD